MGCLSSKSQDLSSPRRVSFERIDDSIYQLPTQNQLPAGSASLANLPPLFRDLNHLVQQIGYAREHHHNALRQVHEDAIQLRNTIRENFRDSLIQGTALNLYQQELEQLRARFAHQTSVSIPPND